MKYAFLLYDVAAGEAPPADDDMARWFAVNRGGEALLPVSEARTVRVRGAKPEVTDGPFAETREQLGGFYILELPDLDAAIEWAKKFPNVESGSVEIRPVMDFSGMQP
jgi:hypothetical protein